MNETLHPRRKCFLSHNSRDKAIAESVGDRLLRHGIDVWFDKWDVFAGDSLTTTIADGISRSDVFLIFLSSNSVRAPWVKEELKVALSRRRKDLNFLLIPVLLDYCEIPEFLQDDVFVDWRNEGNDPFAEILRSIKRVSFRPSYEVDRKLCSIEHFEVEQILSFYGAQGQSAKVVEKFRSKAIAPIDRIDRAINFSGEICDVSCDFFYIERAKVNLNYEKWTLIPSATIDKGRTFLFEVSYDLRNCFTEPSEYWFYSIEALTDRVRIIFDYAEPSILPVISVSHRQGQTTYSEPQQVVQLGQSIVWDKKFPAYKDTYEFMIERGA